MAEEIERPGPGCKTDPRLEPHCSRNSVEGHGQSIGQAPASSPPGAGHPPPTGPPTDPSVPRRAPPRHLGGDLPLGVDAAVYPGPAPRAFNLYLHRVLEESGDPQDPIERMLVEQLCLAHHNIGRLHVQAAAAEHSRRRGPVSARPPCSPASSAARSRR